MLKTDDPIQIDTMKSEQVLELIAEGQAKEHPILFSAPMVRAILNDTKTQTRRAVKDTALDWLGPDMFTPEFVADPANNLCPYGKVGDILWVRETWQYVDFAGEDNGYVYRATDPDWETMEEWRWKPSIFMPKEACRIKLKIEAVRIERLQSITEPDATSEGVSIDTFLDLTAVDKFKALWDKINGTWDSNPFVWVISFSRVGEINSKTSAQ